MNHQVRKILEQWTSSLMKHQELSQKSLSGQLSIVGDYLRSKEDTRKIRAMVSELRDYAICCQDKVRIMLPKLKSFLKMTKTIRKENGAQDEADDSPKGLSHKLAKAYKGESRKIYYERLRFKGNMPLRNFDVQTEEPSDSRKVRRIIEKRMCQAYHNMTKKSTDVDDRSNKKRFQMRRATGFQLYNIGQIESPKAIKRESGTHWKKKIDLLTGQLVLKKKVGYNSREKALQAINVYQSRNLDYRPMNAYLCPTCHMWHIGHDTTSCNANATHTSEMQGLNMKVGYQSSAMM